MVEVWSEQVAMCFAVAFHMRKYGGFLSHGGTPKSSILMGFSWIFHYKLYQFLGTPHVWKPTELGLARNAVFLDDFHVSMGQMMINHWICATVLST